MKDIMAGVVIGLFLFALVVGVTTLVSESFWHPVGGSANHSATSTAEKVSTAKNPGPDKIEPCPEGAFLVPFYKLSPIFDLPLGTTSRSKKEAEALILKAQCLKEWAKGLEDRCIRDNYLSWLDYYERDIRKDLEPQGRPADDDPIAKAREQERKAREYERSHVVPSPGSVCDLATIKKLQGGKK